MAAAKPRDTRREFVSYRIGRELKARLRRASERTGQTPSRLTRIALARLCSAIEAGQHITPEELTRDVREEERARGWRPRQSLPADQLSLIGDDTRSTK